jgi:hypothetical protein
MMVKWVDMQVGGQKPKQTDKLTGIELGARICADALTNVSWH